MKSPAERGRIGAWAYEARADADLSVEEVVERLTRAGSPVAAATIRGIESGSKQPGRRLLRAMATVYERQAPGEEEPAGPSQEPTGFVELAGAIRDQTAAINRLVIVLTAGRSPEPPLELLPEVREALRELVESVRADT